MSIKPTLTIATPAKSQVHSKYVLSLLNSMQALSQICNIGVEILPLEKLLLVAQERA